MSWTIEKIIKTKKELLECLEKNLGIVTAACKEIGCHRQTYYKWYNTDSVFKKRADEIHNTTLDFVEMALLQAIKNGSVDAMKFYLTHRGNKRGYVQRMSIDGAGNEEKIVINIQSNTQINNITNNEDRLLTNDQTRISLDIPE